MPPKLEGTFLRLPQSRGQQDDSSNTKQEENKISERPSTATLLSRTRMAPASATGSTRRLLGLKLSSSSINLIQEQAETLK